MHTFSIYLCTETERLFLFITWTSFQHLGSAAIKKYFSSNGVSNSYVYVFLVFTINKKLQL